ncbi:hypothetical protein GOB94_12295 [Granulicella sp. 5B5]|uniref:hypothetical protein n=1 Tax=Granulicella sp. 5B5 TaxID=1617967 RepID=UPI0015F35B9B|nr:hypothetical protein [Granulicella sp. 5B5]QMV19375.1 hypothetical protein GOB94_12295 [Granulicella sp. 5B5]
MIGMMWGVGGIGNDERARPDVGVALYDDPLPEIKVMVSQVHGEKVSLHQDGSAAFPISIVLLADRFFH